MKEGFCASRLWKFVYHWSRARSGKKESPVGVVMPPYEDRWWNRLSSIFVQNSVYELTALAAATGGAWNSICASGSTEMPSWATLLKP